MMSPLALALSYRPPTGGTGSVIPTDVIGAYRDAYHQQMQKYQADLARENAMWGGLASLGGTVLGSAIGGPLGGSLGGLFGGGLGSGGMGLPTGMGASTFY